MDDNKLRFGVGVLVIAAIGIGVILTFLFGAFPAILNSEYVLYVKFPSAEGINTNTPVTRDGVKIGRVADIQLQDEGGVVLALAMDTQYPMTHRYIPQIGIGSLITGDSKLEFQKATQAELTKALNGNLDLINERYADGDKLDFGKKLEDPFTLLFGMEDELRETFRSIRGAGDAVQEVGQSIEVLVRDVRGVIGVAPPAAAPRGPVPFPSSDLVPRSDLGPNHPSSPPIGTTASLAPATNLDLAGALPAAPSWAKPVVRLTSGSQPNQRSHFYQTAVYQNPLQSNQPLGNVPPMGNVPPPAARATLADVAEEAIETLNEFQGAVRDVRQILGSDVLVESLNAAAERLPGVIDDASQTLETTQQTFDSFRRVGEQFEQVGIIAEQAVGGVSETLESFRGTAENVEQFTEPFADRGEEIIEAALRSLANLDRALIQINTFGQALNSNDGTLRRIIEDDELYFQIRRSIQNIEAATARVRPILDDVRVFTDKIARDPRQLGIRGALTNRPSGMGLK